MKVSRIFMYLIVVYGHLQFSTSDQKQLLMLLAYCIFVLLLQFLFSWYTFQWYSVKVCIFEADCYRPDASSCHLIASSFKGLK